ncbi:MAG: nuclear transport factor 2 family protein, partial [Elusimicrobia bacterium]|nr:nuclear transport factor 2 family protein [Elusimicrobiota bacterium]
RVYRGARPWPEPSSERFDPPSWSSQTASAFDRTFGRGDLEGWLSQWAPDGLFISAVGPFSGLKEVREFFSHQDRRYSAKGIAVSRDHGAAPDGALVVEGTLSGRCRDGGAAFSFPFIMDIGRRGGSLRFVYEAFAGLDDGCGPFWTLPR